MKGCIKNTGAEDRKHLDQFDGMMGLNRPKMPLQLLSEWLQQVLHQTA